MVLRFCCVCQRGHSEEITLKLVIVGQKEKKREERREFFLREGGKKSNFLRSCKRLELRFKLAEMA